MVQAALVLPDRQERLQSQQHVGLADQRVERGLLDPVLIQEHARFLAGKLGDLQVDLAEEGHHPGAQAGLGHGEATNLFLQHWLLRLVERVRSASA
jgi:hypothetical protein